jgi:hypothetical protein
MRYLSRTLFLLNIFQCASDPIRRGIKTLDFLYVPLCFIILNLCIAFAERQSIRTPVEAADLF